MPGAKVEIIGRIEALDSPDCTFLQIQPFGKQKVWFLNGRLVRRALPGCYFELVHNVFAHRARASQTATSQPDFVK